MEYWNSILNGVLQKNDDLQLDMMVDPFSLDDLPIRVKEPRDFRTYYLGDDYPNMHVTKREAESMFWLVQGLTIAETAGKLKLSSRTVEFYVKNLKLKLNCMNKRELIEKILQTSLLQQLEQDGLKIVKH